METKKILEEFRRDITDCVFLYIQHNRPLMDQYLAMDPTARDNFNRKMGEAVRDFFNLDNLDENNAPRSMLIKSYTMHTPRE